MNQTSIHHPFVERFSEASTTPAPQITEAHLDLMEREFRVFLPSAYREFALRHGAVRTPSILHVTVDNDIDLADLHHFTEGDQLIDAARVCWKGGMSQKMIPFASDCMGNLFCFRRTAIQAKPHADSPIWFFDHDFGTEEQIADGFDAWLAHFLTLPTSAETPS